MKPSLYKLGSWSGLGVALFAAFWAGSAWASRQDLDEANAHVAKALKSLKAAEATASAKPHVEKAVGLLTRAEGEILKARQANQAPAE